MNICQSETRQTLYSFLRIKKKFILSTQAARLKSPQTPVERPKVIRGGDLVVSACVHVFGCANVHVRVITKGGSEMP